VSEVLTKALLGVCHAIESPETAITSRVRATSAAIRSAASAYADAAYDEAERNLKCFIKQVLPEDIAAMVLYLALDESSW
jgi:hypothetical protein